MECQVDIVISDMVDIDKSKGIHVLFIFHNDLNTNSAAR